MEIAKALSVEVDVNTQQESDEEFKSVSAYEQPQDVSTLPEVATRITANRVKCNPSPFFYVFFKHHSAKIVIDTGATSSLISADFVKRVNLHKQPTNHAARQVDETALKDFW